MAREPCDLEEPGFLPTDSIHLRSKRQLSLDNSFKDQLESCRETQVVQRRHHERKKCVCTTTNYSKRIKINRTPSTKPRRF